MSSLDLLSDLLSELELPCVLEDESFVKTLQMKRTGTRVPSGASVESITRLER